MISYNVRQAQCNHDFPVSRDEDGNIAPREDAICQKCGMRLEDIKMPEYEPPIGEYDESKWRKLK